MYQDCQAWVKSCVGCSIKKTPHVPRNAPILPIPVQSGWDMTAIDVLGPFPVTHSGNCYIIVFTDYLTRWPECFAVKNADAVTTAARARARRIVRGRGRERGGLRGRRGANPRPDIPVQPAVEGYDVPDVTNQLPNFTPNRPSGLHFEIPILRGAMTSALDFFKLFFTSELITSICQHTNSYAWANIANKQSFADKDGAWQETTPEEMGRFFALILYCGLVDVSSFHRYWSTKSLYHGLWARTMMTRERFKALMAMLHVVDPQTEDPTDKLRKVSRFIDYIKERCKSLYQPFQNISIDERMVKSKHRS